MKSMLLTAIKQMKMADVEMPKIQNDADVLVKMQTVGICGSDVHYYLTGKIGSQVVQFPYPLGWLKIDAPDGLPFQQPHPEFYERLKKRCVP